ncbi:hypothetical protein HMN09_00807100 [Mycena chlorophos]|uniref:ASST-domain-containing protein n=1 Tax=Mycena chlorophos TaxID=658473 RepID=A0A8H6SVE0_MYCCL|nr:hypothetical protein HMN09_00807100 [Mycena chlorophos]
MKVLASTFVLLSITPVFAIYEVTYKSSPLAIQPLTILYRDPSYDPDNTTLFLVSPAGTAIEQPAPVIYDSTGQLVWADPSIGNTNDLNLQTYASKPVLTMWVGAGNPGAGMEVGNGTAQLYDETYSFVADVSAVNGNGGTDFHELQIVKPENTSAIVTAYNAIPADLSSIGGPVQGWYLATMFQEIDIKTGNVLFNWSAFDHIPLSESKITLAESSNGTSPQTAFDAVHINSVDKDTDGHYLISGRHTWTLYKVNATDGNIIWRLGGHNSSFANTTADASFFWQHDARWRSADTVTVFDDGSAVVGQDPPTVILSEPYSSGKMLQLNEQNKTFQLVKQFVPSPNVAPSFAEGSVETYGSHVVVGYGTNPWITVHDLATQKVLFSAVIGPNNSSLWQGAISDYRAYQTTKSIFVGQPKTSPSIAVDNSTDTGTVYVSWNGATQVDRYALFTGLTASRADKPLRTVVRTGFETEMSASGSLGYVQVAALAADGGVLGRTAIVNTGGDANSTPFDDMKLLSSTFVLLSITRVFAIYEVTYHSSPLAIQPLTILYRDPSYDPDNNTLFLVSPTGTAIEQPAPAIYDSTGQLVWADPAIGNTNDLNLQTYAGKPVLTMWVGPGNPGAGPEVGDGTAQIYDETYSLVANISAVNGIGGTDFHEFQIVKPENKSAIVTAYNAIPADLSSIGGPVQGWYLTTMFQEIDIATGHVLFNWSAFDHIPLSESKITLAESSNGTTPQTAFDAVHINSVDKDTDGHYLVSGRHTWTLYKVNATDGNIIWRLGGNNSSFANTTADAAFFWQHDARWQGADKVTVFDDGSASFGQSVPPTVIITEPYSSGKMLQLNEKNKTFELVKRFVPSQGLNPAPSFAEGSVEIYGSQVVVGYGSNPWITVHDLATQKVLFSAVIGPNNSSLWHGAISNYRAYQTTKSAFVGKPKTSPAIAVQNGTVYVSWNGATRVAKYALSTGTTASTVNKALRTVSRTGFETEMSAKGSLGYVQVAALAADGSVLGRTKVVST